MTNSVTSSSTSKASVSGRGLIPFSPQDLLAGGRLLHDLFAPILKGREPSSDKDLPPSERRLVTKGYVLIPRTDAQEKASPPAQDTANGVSTGQPSYSSRLGRSVAANTQVAGPAAPPQPEATPASTAAPQKLTDTTSVWPDLQSPRASAEELVEYAQSLNFDTRTSVTHLWQPSGDVVLTAPQFDGNRTLDGLGIFLSNERPEQASQLLRECARPGDLILSRDETMTRLECDGLVLARNCKDRSNTCWTPDLLMEMRDASAAGRRVFFFGSPLDIDYMIDAAPVGGLEAIPDWPVFPFIQIGNATTWGEGHGEGGSYMGLFPQCEPTLPGSEPSPTPTSDYTIPIIAGLVSAAIAITGAVVMVNRRKNGPVASNATRDTPLDTVTTVGIKAERAPVASVDD